MIEANNERTLLPCPFCGKVPDMEDFDTLYPSGIGWKDHEDGTRSYHFAMDVPKEQWCWLLHCFANGGCGAEMRGDSRDEVVTKWNTRVKTTV
jgi:hypothetical protein